MIVDRLFIILVFYLKTASAIKTGFYTIGIFCTCSNGSKASQTELNRDAQEFAKVLKLIHEATAWETFNSESRDGGDSFDPGDSMASGHGGFLSVSDNGPKVSDISTGMEGETHYN